LIEHLAANASTRMSIKTNSRTRRTAIQKKIQGKQISLSEAPVPPRAKRDRFDGGLEGQHRNTRLKGTASLKERKEPKRATAKTAARKSARR